MSEKPKKKVSRQQVFTLLVEVGRKDGDDLPKDAAADLGEDGMRMVRGGPNRREHDHIGNFNFKVEIEGVTVTSSGDLTGLR